MQNIIFMPTNRLDDPPKKIQCITPACDFVAYSLQSLKIVLNKWMVFHLYHLHFV